MNSTTTIIDTENEINVEKTLSFLHRDHVQSLELCSIIRMGIRRKIDPKRIKNYADWYYINQLVPHFQIEKEHIFPNLGTENVFVHKVLIQHRRLAKHFIKKNEVEKSLSRIEDDLETLIRFEEKNIFNAIRNNFPSYQILLNEEVLSHEFNNKEWDDIFWQ
ncbi:hypothetical protein [Flavobacterium sp. KMS]|jgi:hypothetical protein|uniref:hypothetical protein n=1 Tax=Flavobacterium sp. KMS TaxID=1566023 RepID=UPI00068E4696|nr:hypothetical protein [Flavobacterium sp. KMS]